MNLKLKLTNDGNLPLGGRSYQKGLNNPSLGTSVKTTYSTAVAEMRGSFEVQTLDHFPWVTLKYVERIRLEAAAQATKVAEWARPWDSTPGKQTTCTQTSRNVWPVHHTTTIAVAAGTKRPPISPPLTRGLQPPLMLALLGTCKNQSNQEDPS